MKVSNKVIKVVFSEMGRRAQKKISTKERVRRAGVAWKTRRSKLDKSTIHSSVTK